MGLDEYRRRRDFDSTDEPPGAQAKSSGKRYVIQKHAASRLHYDFRLELDGVLKSWAVPKGPSLDPDVKSLAVHVEDHPLEYGSFEGVIPQGQYGGGTVMLWDQGQWEAEGDARQGYRRGKLVFRLDGERLKGRWVLFRMGKASESVDKNWLLRKLDDAEARPTADYDVLKAETRSVSSNRTMAEIANPPKRAGGGQRKKKSQERTNRSKRRQGHDRKSDDSGSLDLTSLEGARTAAMPARLAPELPSLVEHVPRDEGWLFELKFDGYRMIGFVREGKTSLRTRRGNDWTSRFPAIAKALEGLGVGDLIVDGEIVALRSDGTSDFQALQNMMRRKEERQLIYYVFDLLHFHGVDLRGVQLLDRKRLLASLLSVRKRSGPIRYSDHISGQGSEVFTNACIRRLEGVVAKRADSRYHERRSLDWVKIKCLKRQEFVIGGWTEPGGARSSLGAVLVGYFGSHNDLVYCGRVGTGFSEASLRDLRDRLSKLEREQSPFHSPLEGAEARGVVHWAAPELVAEVEFSSWTSDGRLRHAAFRGLREDKAPKQITLEVPVDTPPRNAEDRSTTPTSRRRQMAAEDTAIRDESRARSTGESSFRLTHSQRVLFPEEGITKGDLARYYETVAPFILPHLIGRPLSLVRCPDGRSKPCFFQKHLGKYIPEAVRTVAIEEKSGSDQAIVIDDLEGLIALVQMSVLEIHPWGSRADRLDQPDRLIIDMDPGPTVGWNDVVRAAFHVKERLADLGLQSFVRTTGGHGLHAVVPLVRRVSWSDLKAMAKALADAMVREDPDRYIAQSSKAKRTGKIFIDYLRNQKGATAIAAYSTRMRPGATVATPLAWSELESIKGPSLFNTQTVPRRLSEQTHDPWDGFFEVRQSITQTMRRRFERE